VIVRLHIDRLVVDEGVLARGERGGVAHAIEHEVRRRLADPQPPPDWRRPERAPAHIEAIGAAIVERIPPAGPRSEPHAGGAT